MNLRNRIWIGTLLAALAVSLIVNFIQAGNNSGQESVISAQEAEIGELEEQVATGKAVEAALRAQLNETAEAAKLQAGTVSGLSNQTAALEAELGLLKKEKADLASAFETARTQKALFEKRNQNLTLENVEFNATLAASQAENRMLAENVALLTARLEPYQKVAPASSFCSGYCSVVREWTLSTTGPVSYENITWLPVPEIGDGHYIDVNLGGADVALCVRYSVTYVTCDSYASFNTQQGWLWNGGMGCGSSCSYGIMSGAAATVRLAEVVYDYPQGCCDGPG